MEYVDKFKEIGIVIADYSSTKDMPRPAWLRTYEEYRLFLSEYHRRPRSTERKLYMWQNEMQKRYQRGNLKPMQIDMLRQVGIIE